MSTDVMTIERPAYREARRELTGVTVGLERRALGFLVERLPAWVTPDHLTVLAVVAMAFGGVCYAAGGRQPVWLLGACLALALNWFGDSLDGTLARHRQKLRPRYGFYVDHVADVFGALMLLSGLAVSGLVGTGVAAALLVAYLLFSVHLYLATHTLGRFKMSYGGVGGTELRLMLIAANLLVMAWPRVQVFGADVRLFDVFAVPATLLLVGTFVKGVFETTRELYRLERV